MKTQKNSVIAAVAVLLAAAGVVFLRHNFAPRILASGDFHQVAHKGAGRAEIIQKKDGRRVLRLTGLRTTLKPDLYVYLISAPDALENETVKRSEIFSLGPLKSGEDAEEEYPLPDELDLEKYGAVTIWNRRYEVNFTTAPLKSY
jgi:hypothetical protein